MPCGSRVYTLSISCRAASQACLPVGSVQPYWTTELATIWAAATRRATTAPALARCLLLLEDAIRPQWLVPAASAALRGLPSRAGALSVASRGSLALRLFTLDGSLMYDKLELTEDGPTSLLAATPATSSSIRRLALLRKVSRPAASSLPTKKTDRKRSSKSRAKKDEEPPDEALVEEEEEEEEEEY